MAYLKSIDRVDNWTLFFQEIKQGTFPPENIAFELFLDVVKWYIFNAIQGKSETLLELRIQIVQANIYKIYGWFRGFKNKGDIVKGDGRRVEIFVEKSKLNFAIPGR